MKNNKIALSIIAIVASVAIVFSGCKKINEATELGGGLIPPIDNINTFETFLDIETDNLLFADTTKVYFNDDLALGHISNDPEFGVTHADAYFNISSSNYFTYPFINRDSVTIDSVILSLSYQGSYGDTNSFQTIRVFEIAQNAGFNDSTLYRYGNPDFLTTGPELGAKTFQIKKLSDSIQFIRKKDTSKLANVIRIPLDNQLGVRLKGYDTTNTANGGFRTDSIFKTLFRGLAIKSDNSGNALTYIASTDNIKTKLIVYFQVTKNGIKDTTSTEFYHLTGGQANIVKRTQGGGWDSYLTNGTANDDKIYLQGFPGSYASLKIPGLDTFSNAVIHRAEIVATPLRSTQDDIFVQPFGLFLDRINTTGDTASTFDIDMSLTNNFTAYTYDISSFGGLLKSDSTYRFNISRYVQNIITTRNTNYKLRLYSPIRAFVYSPGYKAINQVYVTDRVAYGRVVLAGGSYINPSKRMRLRLVYSKL
ncbi:MAG: DUF4270 family protein [Chitinophagaceae bacterium]|nr:DUF4270 family protein [Chitinophagaceae bacterium]MBP6215030.1 DUF4270 family protein [Chitinophagaceae bacterium]